MPTLFPFPAALQLGGDITRGVHRRLAQLSTAAGKFSVRPYTLGAVGTHPLHLEFDTLDQIDDLWGWYENDIMGAFQPFWLPTFQRDFVPIGLVAAVDIAFTMLDRGYADFEFPDVNRRTIAMIAPDGTTLKRDITAAASNLDGTETLTLSSAFGVDFTQQRANGICHLLHCRLQDDLVKLDWWTHDIASCDVTVIEVRDAPLTGAVL